MNRLIPFRSGLGLTGRQLVRLSTLLVTWLLIGLPAQLTLQACISPLLLEQAEEEEASKSKAEESPVHSTRSPSRVRYRVAKVDGDIHGCLLTHPSRSGDRRPSLKPALTIIQGAGIGLRC